MFAPGSRYEQAREFSPSPEGRPGFIRPREIRTLPGAVEHRVGAGDRLDVLAQHYYADARMWWRILDANPQFLLASEVEHATMAGRVIVVPGGGS